MPRIPTRACALALAFALAASLAGAGCGDEREGGAILPDLRVDAVGPATLLPGSRLVVRGGGFVVADVANLAVILRGVVTDGGGAPRAIELAALPERVDDQTLALALVGDLEQALFAGPGRFVGEVSVWREPLVDAEVEVAARGVDLTLALALVPRVDALGPTAAHVGETLTLSGADFLHPGEGVSVVELRGTMTTDSPPRQTAISDLQLPAAPPSREARDALTFDLSPDLLGIRPGRFSGTVTVINLDRTGQPTGEASLDVASLELREPAIEAMAPLAASRGQWITLEGRGFTATDGLLQAATLIELEGRFTTLDGASSELTGPRAITLVPDLVVDHTDLRAVLRVGVDSDGRLTGLGLVPGTFTGTVAPLVLFGADATRGQALPVTFSILPQRQVVYIKLLPGFDAALAEFGLASQKEGILRRLLEVVERDYAGVSVAFTLVPPVDFAEYAIVEVAGYDPNGTQLFGLDNTSGKDTGNVRFDDVIGGYNAETGATGYAAYGGIFPGEFKNLSPSLSDNPLTSPRFDDIFRPVMPALGGVAAAPGDEDDPGQRGAQVREAVRVFANLLGNTISHEVGHSLGLAAIDGQFHNVGDNPGWLMDSGANRPFEERAELDGAGPSFFSPRNRAYLEEILPVAP